MPLQCSVEDNSQMTKIMNDRLDFVNTRLMRGLRAMYDRPLNQGKLGALVGLEQSEISRIERGKRKPTKEELSRIATVLGVNVEALISK